MAARVVDFPDPDGPVTIVIPRRVWATSRSTAGKLSWSIVATVAATTCMTSPALPRWPYRLHRNRPSPSKLRENRAPRNMAPFMSSAIAWGAIDAVNWRRAVTSIAGLSTLRIRPPIRTCGAEPDWKWTSEAP